MKVQVTKDDYGYLVWVENVDLVFQKPGFKKIANLPEQIAHKFNQEKPVWMTRKWHPFKTTKIFSSKFIKKFMPEITKLKLMDGDIKVLDLNISKPIKSKVKSKK